MIGPAANQRIQDRAKKREKARQVLFDADLQDLAGLPAGRRVIAWLLVNCHMFRPTFAGDAFASIFRDGERNAALRLSVEMKRACPDGFRAIVAEMLQLETEPGEPELEPAGEEENDDVDS